MRHRGTTAWADKLMALVKWYEVTAVPLGERGSHSPDCVPWAVVDSEYDVIDASAIRRPVVLQPRPDPDMQDTFVHNIFL